MPIDNITKSQKQIRVFGQKLSEELDRKNKLYQLRELINWLELEKAILPKIKINQMGRTKKCPRIMLGLAMLQAMYNLSDDKTVEAFTENIYWQYFCGYEYWEAKVEISEASIRRFRKVLGEDGYNIILGEVIRVGTETGIYKKKDFENIIVDTTVQIKNVKHPHDIYLMGKARCEATKLCQKLGIALNETYAKTFKRNTIKFWKYKQDSKSKNRWKIVNRLKTRLGRLVRIIERHIESEGLELTGLDKEILFKITAIYNQSALSKKAKEEYKKDHKIIYSFSASETECIGKGKLHKPYEFGVKTGIATSGTSNFVLAVKSFPGNPYDGHTLKQTVEAAESLTGVSVKKIFVDLGYRGNNLKEKSKVYTPYTKKKLSNFDKKMQKRRSAIEPVIGHLKHFGRMARNYLKGTIGDLTNPIISAIGFNLRGLANGLALRSS